MAAHPMMGVGVIVVVSKCNNSNRGAAADVATEAATGDGAATGAVNYWVVHKVAAQHRRDSFGDVPC